MQAIRYMFNQQLWELGEELEINASINCSSVARQSLLYNICLWSSFVITFLNNLLNPTLHKVSMNNEQLVGGFNPFEKY